MADQDEPELLVVVAHGLLNAVAPIAGVAELLLDRELPPEERNDMLQLIIRRTDVAMSMLRDLAYGLPLDLEGPDLRSDEAGEASAVSSR